MSDRSNSSSSIWAKMAGAPAGGGGPSESAGSMPPRFWVGDSSKAIVCAASPWSILSRSKATTRWPSHCSVQKKKLQSTMNWLTDR